MSAFWPKWLGSSTTNPTGTYVAGSLGTGWDASINSNVLRQTYINGFLDVSATSIFRYDVSMNGNLFIAPGKCSYFGGDVSLANRLFVIQDTSLNGRLFVGQDTSLNGRLFVGQDMSLNGRLFVGQDISLNGNLFVKGNSIINGDISLNGNIVVYGNLRVQQVQNANIINTTINNYQLVITDDISLNGRLLVSQDASFGGNLIINPAGTATTGFVGIGKTNPAYPLDVNGTLNTRITANATAFQSNFAPLAGSGVASAANIDLFSGSTIITANAAYGARIAGGLLQNTGAYLSFSSSSNGTLSEVMRIQRSSGIDNVGIGTTTPGYTLDVNGNGRFTTGLNVSNGGTEAAAGSVRIGGTYDTGVFLQIQKAGAVSWGTTTAYDATRYIRCTGNAENTKDFNVGPGGVGIGYNPPTYTTGGAHGLYVSGSVGINTNSPTQALDVNGAIVSSTGISIANNSVLNFGYNLTKEGSAGRIGYGAFSSGTCLDIVGAGTSSGSRLIQFFDRVGIGTSGPAGPLHIHEATGSTGSATSGSLTITHGNTGGSSSIIFPSKNNAGSDRGYIVYQDDSAQNGGGEQARLMIGTEDDNTTDFLILQKSGGYVGIGTMTPAYILQVNGQTAATSFNATSDYRIKDNVKPLDESFTIDNIKPVSFTNKLLKRQDIGMIAHEVQEEYPYLVTGEKDGEDNQTVNYTGFIGLLIHEVKQLKEQMKQMQSEIEIMKANR